MAIDPIGGDSPTKPTQPVSLEDAFSQVDWDEVAAGAAEATNERRQGTIFDRLRQAAIDAGEGTGSIDLDIDAVTEDDGGLGDYFDRLRRAIGGQRDYLTSDSFTTDLIRANLANGNITQSQAINELMSKLRLDYDEAEELVLGWSGGAVNEGQATDDPFGTLLDTLFGDGGGGGGGGRGSGGGAARVYKGPDAGLVEDWVKSRLVTLVGRADPGRVKMLTEEYFAADRKAFGGEEVDPKQSVLEKIRSFDDYSRIHANRTDAQDEDTWISGQMSALLAAGVSGTEAQELAINFAQAGVAQARAGELSEARRVGNAPTQALPGFFRKVQDSMSTVARSIR